MKAFKSLNIFLLCLAFLFSFRLICSAQNNADKTLIPFMTEEKWGYINNKGKIVIKPQFDEADKFSEGLARVQIGLKSGFIDSTGKFVIEPIYTFAFGFSEGLAPVGKDMNSQWGYIDRTGKIIIEPQFEHARRFSNGLAHVSVILSKKPFDWRSGFIDKKGNFAINPKFAYSEDFKEGFAIIAEDNKANETTSAYFNKKAFIDSKGNLVTPFFENAEDFSEGVAAVKIENRWGFIDKTGNIVIAPQFDFILREFSEGIAFVNCDNDKVGAIDKTGRMITECIFDEAWGFSEGLSAVQLDGKFGFINTRGNFVIKPQFDYVQPFYNGLAEVKIKKDGWIFAGFIDHKGKFVFKPVKYEKIEPVNDETIEIE